MDNKMFFHYIKELNDISKQPNTFGNRRQAKKIKKAINKMIKGAAKAQANIVYNQTVELYQNILTSNLD
jgi:hypothetical protein